MSDTTIAQALRRVNKLKGLIKEHQNKAVENASYDQDNKSEFDFDEEVQAMNDFTNEMINLKAKISAANAECMVSDGKKEMPLAIAVLALIELKGIISFYKSLHLRSGLEKTKEQEWDDNLEKYVNKKIEITYIAAMTEKARTAKLRSLEDRFEVLNNAVEDTNHKVFV